MGRLCAGAVFIGLRSKNGRIDHASDSHDDMVVAWLLPYWFLTEASNKSFYGLNPNNTLTTVKATQVEEAGGMDAVRKREDQIRIRTEIERLASEMKLIKHLGLVAKSKNKIQYLYNILDPSSLDTLNIDTLLEKIELDKRRAA